MTKVEITKTVAHNMIGYSVGAAATAFFATNRRHSDNVAVEILINVSTVVTAIAAGGVATKPLNVQIDDTIDSVVDWWNATVKKESK